MLTPARISTATANRIRRLAKLAVSLRDTSGPDLPDIAFVFGCQRSGTTMMLDVFERDLRTRVYRDVGVLTTAGGPGSIRFNPLDEVEAEFRRTRAEFAVAKPLADSQRAPELLAHFPRARGLWMYRDFRDVASSDLRYFGMENGVSNLVPVVERNAANWRSEGASEDVTELVRRWFSPDMNPYDAAALFWYARNALFFELELDRHPRVRLLRYETFVRSPVDGMREIYEWMGRAFPGPRMVSEVHQGAVGKKRHLDLTPEISTRCQELQDRLEAAEARQGSVRHAGPAVGHDAVD